MISNLGKGTPWTYRQNECGSRNKLSKAAIETRCRVFSTAKILTKDVTCKGIEMMDTHGVEIKDNGYPDKESYRKWTQTEAWILPQHSLSRSSNGIINYEERLQANKGHMNKTLSKQVTQLFFGINLDQSYFSWNNPFTKPVVINSIVLGMESYNEAPIWWG